MADAWLFARLEVGVDLEAESGAGQRDAQQLHDQCQHRAFHPADRGQAAGQRRLRIGRRVTVPVRRPAQGNGLSFLGVHHDFPAHHFRQRQVDDYGIGAAPRKNRSDRIGAEKSFLTAPCVDRGRGVGEREPDQPCPGHRREMIGRRAEMMAVRDAGERDAVALRALDRFLDRERRGRKRESACSVHQAGRTVALEDPRLRLAIRAPLAQVLRVELDARKAVPAESFQFGGDQRVRRRLRHRPGGAGALQRSGRDSSKLCVGDARHEQHSVRHRRKRVDKRTPGALQPQVFPDDLLHADAV